MELSIKSKDNSNQEKSLLPSAFPEYIMRSPTSKKTKKYQSINSSNNSMNNIQCLKGYSRVTKSWRIKFSEMKKVFGI
jgi:hypothetical protein